MSARLSLAVTAGKLAGTATRLLGRGGGTALPGLVAERVDPRHVASLGRQLGGGRVLITGTNGKTTTSRLLAAILDRAGRPYVHNREGSNLMRGIGATLVAEAGLGGSIANARGRTGLFETDEATLPPAARALQPNAITFINLFRDQLDRYGEVETVIGFWQQAIAALPRDATLVLNADDPSVAALADGWEGPVHWFGVDDPALATDTPGAHDARWCPACGSPYTYGLRYFAHVGHWRCSGCDRVRPEPGTVASALTMDLDAATFTLDGHVDPVHLPVTGLYNVVNALAAAATAKVLGVEDAAIREGLETATAAFGRQEVVDFEGRRLRLMLCKNPAGANQVLRLLAGLDGDHRVALLLNDNFADGQDVSWIWDVDLELLGGRVSQCWASGDRNADLVVRMKYAGWPPALASREPARLLEGILGETSPGDEVVLLPTYTAMLALREELRKRGAVSAFWRES